VTYIVTYILCDGSSGVDLCLRTARYDYHDIQQDFEVPPSREKMTYLGHQPV